MRMYCRKWLHLHTFPNDVVLVPLEKQYQAKKSLSLCILLEHRINACFTRTLKTT